MTPVSLRVPKETSRRLPGRTRWRSVSGSAYVNGWSSGTGRLTSQYRYDPSGIELQHNCWQDPALSGRRRDAQQFVAAARDENGPRGAAHFGSAIQEGGKTRVSAERIQPATV